MPRQTFRDVQEVLFPAFFQMSALCVALLLALSPESGPANALSALAPAFAAVLANLLFLEHKTTDVMKRRAALERMDDAAALAAYPGLGKKLALKQLGGQFGKWHGLSSAANLVALCGAIAFGWGLAL